MSIVESRFAKAVTPFFIATAVIEWAAGLALIVAPAMVISLLFGSIVDVVATVGVGRLAGAALLALGTACWWARTDQGSAASRAIVVGMLIYNAAVVALVLVGALGPLGLLQWAALVLHGAQAIWCVRIVTTNGSSR